LAAGEYAAGVAVVQSGADGFGDESLRASDVEDFGLSAEDGGDDVRVAGGDAEFPCGQGLAAEGAGAGVRVQAGGDFVPRFRAHLDIRFGTPG
jgi:hypothetical protein